MVNATVRKFKACQWLGHGHVVLVKGAMSPRLAAKQVKLERDVANLLSARGSDGMSTESLG